MEPKNGLNNRILIVDDDEAIHQSFEETLKPISTERSTDELAKAFGSDVNQDFLPDFELLHARSGKEAYRMVEKALEADNPIAVAYIDIRMPPGWDGIETTRKIRRIDSNIEIVIMTAHTEKPLSEIIGDMELPHKLLYLAKDPRAEGAKVIQAMTISLKEKWNAERDLAEKNRQIELNKQRLEAVLDSTMDAIAMFDKAGHPLFVNRWFGKMFSSTREELEKMSADELRQEIKQYFHDPVQFEEAEEQFRANPEDITPRPVEMRIPERKMLSQSIAPVRDTDENIIGHLVVYRDAAREIEMSEIARMKDEYLRLRAELEGEYSFDNIIGKSKKMQDTYALMERAIQSEITVLIRGESGTGKELVAKSIHLHSSRKSKSFVAVNCAAIPETLIESELFGHERGAFTGAAARRIGKFEQADGGTILLDEIGEMSPSLQARLLRVLQEREIQRIGGTTTIPVNVRVIASTNKDLETAMKAGEFREDLFYRVAVFPITIAPLREHPEDIPLLAEHFLNDATERTGKSITVISTEALQLLMNYDWPGNVRELENAIERAVLLETSGILQADHLPPEIHSARKQYRVISSRDEHPTLADILPLEEVEKQALIRALEATGNNIRQTAKVLGINRATVYRKLDKFNLVGKE